MSLSMQISVNMLNTNKYPIKHIFMSTAFLPTLTQRLSMIRKDPDDHEAILKDNTLIFSSVSSRTAMG